MTKLVGCKSTFQGTKRYTSAGSTKGERRYRSLKAIRLRSQSNDYIHAKKLIEGGKKRSEVK